MVSTSNLITQPLNGMSFNENVNVILCDKAYTRNVYVESTLTSKLHVRCKFPQNCTRAGGRGGWGSSTAIILAILII